MSTYRKSIDFERLTIKKDRISLHGLLYEQGFYIGGCTENGIFSLRLTGIKDKELKNKIINSITINE